MVRITKSFFKFLSYYFCVSIFQYPLYILWKKEKENTMYL